MGGTFGEHSDLRAKNLRDLREHSDLRVDAGVEPAGRPPASQAPPVACLPRRVLRASPPSVPPGFRADHTDLLLLGSVTYLMPFHQLPVLTLLSRADFYYGQSRALANTSSFAGDNTCALFSDHSSI